MGKQIKKLPLRLKLAKQDNFKGQLKRLRLIKSHLNHFPLDEKLKILPQGFLYLNSRGLSPKCINNGINFSKFNQNESKGSILLYMKFTYK